MLGRRLVRFTVYGHLPRKSNRRKIARAGKRIMLIKSKDALDYEKSFLEQVPRNAKRGYGNRDQLLALEARIYYRSWRSDVSVELLLDLLQKSGVISNDRWVREFHYIGLVDPKNPRVELTLYTAIL